MKKYIALFIFSMFFILQLSAQCTECNSVEEAMKNPTGVKELIINPHVGGTLLTAFPEGLKKLKNIEILYLTDHGFTTVSKDVGKLKKLKELSLAGNQLTEIPLKQICKLENLKELILYSNDFTEAYKEEVKNQLAKDLPNLKVMFD